MRPLDRLRSIKVKLGVVIVATVAGTVVVLAVGFRLGFPLAVRTGLAALIALAIVQFLARGMTSPLREMAAAASAMARGDYGRRVTATSRDEVGELARAFNAMAAELADVDRMRRDLVANVSHELRTPIGALQALLENLVDGVEPPDPRRAAHGAGPDRAPRPPGRAAARPLAAGERRAGAAAGAVPGALAARAGHARVRAGRDVHRPPGVAARGRPARRPARRSATPSGCTR